MKAYYDMKPDSIEPVGNGSYFYRYNIVSLTEDEHTQWMCDEVVIWSPLTREKIVDAVIKEKWNDNVEKKLINDYNTSKEGIFDEEKSAECIAAYRNFLTERTQLKNMVNSDWEEYNEEIF